MLEIHPVVNNVTGHLFVACQTMQRGKEAAEAGWRLKQPSTQSSITPGDRRCVRKYTPYHLRSALQASARRQNTREP